MLSVPRSFRAGAAPPRSRPIAAWRECPVERRAQAVISKTAEQMLQQSTADDDESLLHVVDCPQFLSNMSA